MLKYDRGQYISLYKPDLSAKAFCILKFEVVKIMRMQRIEVSTVPVRTGAGIRTIDAL